MRLDTGVAVVAILQCTNVSNQHIIPLIRTVLYVDYISILKNKVNKAKYSVLMVVI